jgi:hypothetical protein
MLLTVRYVPEWCPGMGWKRQARIWKKTVTRLADAPFEYVRQMMVLSGFQIKRNLTDDNL